MWAVLPVVALLLVGCTVPNDGEDDASSPSPTPGSTTATATPSDEDTQPTPTVRFDADRALRDVRLLAGRIGPRLATSPAYDEAARVVAQRFRELGYEVTRQRFPVPAGDSWGTPVEAGFSSNVIASPAGFDPAAEHLLVGAHLDSVAGAPGAEDNASGVSVLLELARLAAMTDPRLPTLFVAFGGEEPVGSGDALHHFGSRHYVDQMGPAQRRGLEAMVSLDRVGVGDRVPVCTGPLSPPPVQRALRARAARLDIAAFACANTASDHWSFEKAGYAVARLGSTPYPAYHSPRDVPAVVEVAQLRRVGRVAWAWLRRP